MSIDAPAQAAAPPVRTRLRWGRIAGVALLLAALAGSIVAAVVATGDHRERAAVGSVRSFYEGDVTGTDSFVVVPWGRIAVRVSEVLPAVADRTDLRPPSGGGFVEVRIEPDVKALHPLPAKPGSGPMAPQFAVLVGGRSYPVPQLTDHVLLGGGNLETNAQGALVAVAGRATGVTLTVSYDGVTQTLDPRTGARDAGAAAPLYQPVAATSTAKESCGSGSVTAGFTPNPDFPPTCAIHTDRVPYAAGLGWAPAGREWLSVTVAAAPVGRVTWRSPTGKVQSYDADGTGTTQYTVAGRTPEIDVPLREVASSLTLQDPSNPQLVVVGVPTGQKVSFDVVTHQTERPYGDDVPGAPVRPVVTETWHVQV